MRGKLNYTSCMLKRIIAFSFLLLMMLSCFSWGRKKKPTSIQPEQKQVPARVIPADLEILINSYPELSIKAEFKDAQNDYVLTFENNGQSYEFLWAKGSVLPKDELENSGMYWHLIYDYSNVLRDPKTFSEEEIQRLKEYGTVKNRRRSAGTPMFFFDAVYSSFSRKSIEPHIIGTAFLGKNTRVHEIVLPHLKKVEEKIRQMEKTSPEIQVFVRELKSAAAYHWREIDGTNRKSFHSLGIAVDVLPVAYHGGEVFWSWARDKNPEGWMMTPLKKRWMPPKEVIDAFESEGFIWGGYWAIWDNMHFEYHPELIAKMKTKENID